MANQAFRADSPVVDLRWVFERLLAILDTAVSLQPETESVLRSCEGGSWAEASSNNAVLARRASRLTSALLHLVDRANALPGCLVVEEARGLLCYHHRLLTESLEYASGPNAVLGRSDNQGPAGDGPGVPDEADHLGEPAARLRRLRNLIATDLSDVRQEPILPAQLSPLRR